MSPEQDHPSTEPGRGREALRQVAAAGREAVRNARAAAREAGLDERAAAREAAREAREALRDVAREVSRDAGDRAHDARLAGAGGRAEPGPAGTRQRIQQVAVELFSEHGYEATSLREIAERLGVTKAALYYHFKTKDEIIESLFADQAERLEGLIAWADGQPRTLETREEFVRRYWDLLEQGEYHKVMRFFERNQSSMQQHKAGAQMRERMMRIVALMTEPGAPLATQLRRSMAIFAMHAAWFTVRDPDVTDEERRAAALEVADELLR